MKRGSASVYKRRWSRRWSVALLLAVLLLGVGALLYYRGQLPGFEGPAKSSNIEYYTCPMHPQIHEDHPGHCPICHMELVPVYKSPRGATSGSGKGAAHSPENGAGKMDSGRSGNGESVISDNGDRETGDGRGTGEGNANKAANETVDPEMVRRGGVHLSQEQMQLIGVRTAEAKIRTVHSKIETSGRVAFDPELAVAIQEYLEVARRDPSLRRAAVSRLRLLGMGEDEIRQLGKKGDRYSSLYLPGRSSSVWVYANIYESDMGLVRTGAKAVVRFTYESGRRFSGVVRSIAPNVDPVTRSITARIEVSAPGGELRPDSFVNVEIDQDLGERLVIPADSVVYTGTRAIVFVETGPGLFMPREIETGETVAEGVVVYAGLNAGQRIVSSGAFMIDSESQIRPVPLDSGNAGITSRPGGASGDERGGKGNGTGGATGAPGNETGASGAGAGKTTGNGMPGMPGMPGMSH